MAELTVEEMRIAYKQLTKRIKDLDGLINIHSKQASFYFNVAERIKAKLNDKTISFEAKGKLEQQYELAERNMKRHNAKLGELQEFWGALNNETTEIKNKLRGKTSSKQISKRSSTFVQFRYEDGLDVLSKYLPGFVEKLRRREGVDSKTIELFENARDKVKDLSRKSWGREKYVL